MALEQAAAVLGQTDRMVAVPGHARGLDQPLFAQVPQVAGAWISGTAVVVAEITTGDYSERTNGRERSRFGPTQRALAISIVNQLALAPARQMNVARERVPDLAIAFSTVAIALGPAGIVVAVPLVLIRPLSVVSRTASERLCVTIIAVARAHPRVAPVVITIGIAGAASAPTIRRVGVPLVVSRIVVTRV